MGLFDAILISTLAALAMIGWLVGMMRKRAQFWVRFLGPIGFAYMLWYFFFVMLPRSEPAIMAGNVQTGWWTVACMVGGIWALMASPRPERPANDGNDGVQAS